jgi:hypothetical protein
VSPGTSDAATELKRVASSVTADALILISSGSPKVTVPEGFKIVTWYRGVAVVRPVSPSN